MIVVGTMGPLPPDLSRLGDELTAAAARALDERRRRRRMLSRGCASALSGVLAIAVLAPAALSPGPPSATSLRGEAMSAVLVRLPARPSPALASEATDTLLVRLPARHPVLPPIRPERDA
jgi:hypothetical protein